MCLSLRLVSPVAGEGSEGARFEKVFEKKRGKEGRKPTSNNNATPLA
jgi:hypothetical protein